MTSFILNNETIRTDLHPGVTLLDFVREYQSLKGTKIGCREGDCGACTVLVGTLRKGVVQYKTITSCISPLGNANGKHIVTVEGINLERKLNVAQQAMSDCNGTQCGFCTPGFVVSLTAHALNTAEKSLGTINDAISGNICRCTGYQSIENAGAKVEDALQGKVVGKNIDWLIENEFIPNYFSGIATRLAELKIEKPSKSGTLVANGTDLYVHGADKFAEEKVLLIAADDAMSAISQEDGRIIVGANATVTDIVDSPLMQKQVPGLTAFMKLVSSEPIRNMGTLGGNFVNASPIGDMTIFFLALNSSLNIQDADGALRSIPFQSFHQDYKKYDLGDGEIVSSIAFDELDPTTDHFNFEKVCKRTHLDIASVNSALKVSLEGESVADAHVAVGGVAAVPKYLPETGKYLSGKELNAAMIVEANEVLQSEISPISDVRGSADYKRLLARQLFFAHFIRLFPEQIRLNDLMTELKSR